MSAGILIFLVLLFLTVLAARFRITRAGREQSVKTVWQEPFIKEVERSSHYYQMLSDEEKRDFLKRAWFFFNEKHFEARGFEQVSLRMQAIISAYAAQVTFGLPDIHLVHFKTVIVYPASYKSTLTNKWHKGEVNAAGAIVFSWKDLLAGHNDLSDGINLAIHEFAHALRLENITAPDEFGFLDEEVLQQFRKLSALEMKRISDTDNCLLREYGATNEQEFFAVCVENFFERPIAFCEEHPNVYGLLTKLLGQDPLARPIRLQFT